MPAAGSAPTPDWSDAVAHGDWWVRRLDADHDGLGFLIPDGFHAMARVFHPSENEDGTTRTWADIAEANGRTVHPQMQLHAIATDPADEIVFDPNAAPYVSEGELPQNQRDALAAILEVHTDGDACWFGVWDGYGVLHDSVSYQTRHRSNAPRSLQLLQRWVSRRRIDRHGHAPRRVQTGPVIKAPNREYFLMRGSLSNVGAAAALVSPTAGGQTPNLWWPDDHSWFVITEIDFAWTYVCGSAALIDAVLASEVLESLPADRNHHGHYKADQINT